ncbi:hypothetical protein Lsan_1759 [Legionella santicrucis]|uniref:Uncharacterized protein n=1 Tax=Legionella santicrucis TaxID=45074 RepID=A0A0W0Z0V5_9GAMM|nr:hypothetical protein [Legionella santicrucis]KTD62772.1 hypothetical protein Lsan_1759 [Legionella santicrucis]
MLGDKAFNTEKTLEEINFDTTIDFPEHNFTSPENITTFLSDTYRHYPLLSKNILNRFHKRELEKLFSSKEDDDYLSSPFASPLNAA